ncbi:MAG: tRNA pseudouridine(38-40) synthase TruA [Balneolaceae bacterium]
MPRWKLTIRYDGTNYAGWQSQPDQPTIQQEIEKALGSLFQKKIEVVGQGRTDAGVHAEGQTAHSDFPELFKIPRLIHALRGLLPPDIAVVDIRKTEDDFHARFSALSRQYRYQIITVENPVIRNFTWFPAKPLNFDLLNSCAALVKGTHDFVNFSKTDAREFGTTVCTIEHSEWVTKDENIMYRIWGNRFLRHLVRRLVGSMYLTATGRMEIKTFEEMLKAPEMEVKGFSAPAKGLILEKVFY